MVEGVTQLVSKWISKLVFPSSNVITSASVDMHSLLDIKYSLVILENATYLIDVCYVYLFDEGRFMNTSNQNTILQANCGIIDNLLKLIVITRGILPACFGRLQFV